MRQMPEELKEVLRELLDLLEAEGEANRFPGLRTAYQMLTQQGGWDQEAVRTLKSVVLGMFRGGAGTFSDLVLGRENDTPERIDAINEKLERLRNRIAELAEML